MLWLPGAKSGEAASSKAELSHRGEDEVTPLVSVVVPVRNGARWLNEAIDSVVQQTLGDFELLAIDDGSTDATPQILAGWAGRDSRVRTLRQPNLGLVAALNRGLAEARGALLARLDADDRAAPQRLKDQAEIMDGSPNIGLLGTWAQRIDENGRGRGLLKPETRPDKLAEILTRANPFVHSSVMLRTNIARSLGGYRAAFEAAEDYDLWLRISEIASVANIPEPLVQYRRHGDSVSARKAIRQSFSLRLAQRAAQARRRFGRDPATNLTTPPDWRMPEALGTFYSDDAILYRLLDLADPAFACRDVTADFSPLLDRITSLNHAERQLCALAIANYLRVAPPAAVLRTIRLLARMARRRPAMALLALRSILTPRLQFRRASGAPPLVTPKD